MIEKDYIKIPADFQSLHDLKDLLKNFELTSRLQNALNDYQDHYVSSNMMTMDELLNYIPDNKYEEYKLSYRGEETYDMKYKKDDYVQEKMIKRLLKYNIEGQKMFLVDTINKVIDICRWTPAFVENKTKRRVHSDIKYTGENTYDVDSKTRTLSVKVPYSFTDSHPVGGVMINGAGGYLSGESWHKYERNGVEEYQFCIKTNKYLGYKGIIKESERRGWIEKTSRF